MGATVKMIAAFFLPEKFGSFQKLNAPQQLKKKKKGRLYVSRFC